MRLTMTEGDRTASRYLSEMPRRPAGYLVSMYQREIAGYRYALLEVVPLDDAEDPANYRIIFGLFHRTLAHGSAGTWVPYGEATLHVEGSKAERIGLRQSLLQEVSA